MAALDFPDAPTVGQVFDKWTWNGTQWVLTSSPSGTAALPRGFVIEVGTATLQSVGAKATLTGTATTYVVPTGETRKMWIIGSCRFVRNSGSAIGTVRLSLQGDADVEYYASNGFLPVSAGQTIIVYRSISLPAGTHAISLAAQGMDGGLVDAFDRVVTVFDVGAG